jgi:hypothetical protein
MEHHKRILKTIGEVTAGKFAELLVAEVLGGKVVDKPGFDIECCDGRRVEVRSRVEGTDGNAPRITLSKKKMELCTDIVAFRFNRLYEPIEARLVRKAHLEQLYLHYRQRDGSTAHVNWGKFYSCIGAEDLLSSIISAYEAIDS